MMPLGNAIANITFMVNGSSTGTGFLIGPNLISTAKHVVENKKNIILEPSTAGPKVPATVIFADKDNDLALLQIPDGSVSHPWVSLHADAYVDEPCLIIGYPKGRFEYVTCWVEGPRGKDEREIKLTTGQVEPGLSGAAVVSRRRGLVIGQIRTTRDMTQALGGIATSSKVILKSHDLIGEAQSLAQEQAWQTFAERDRIEVEKLARETDPPVWLTARAACVPIYGREAEMEALGQLSSQLICEVVGGRQSGKSEVVKTLLRRIQRREILSPDGEEFALAYLDLRHRKLFDPTVFIRVLRAQMKLDLPESEVIGISSEEQIASLADAVAQRTDGRHLWVVVDHASYLLELSEGQVAFRQMLSMLQANATRVLLPLYEPLTLTQQYLAEARPIEVNEFSLGALTKVIEKDMSLTSDRALAIASELSVERTPIGTLRRTTKGLSSVSLPQEPTLAAALIRERADSQNREELIELVRLATEAEYEWTDQLIESSSRVLVYGDRLSLDAPGVEQGVRDLVEQSQNEDFDHDGTGFIYQLLSEILQTDDVLGIRLCASIDRLLETGRPKLGERRLQLLIDSLGYSTAPEYRKLRGRLSEELVVRTARDPLGPVVLWKEDFGYEAPLTRFVALSKSSTSPLHFYNSSDVFLGEVGAKLTSANSVQIVRIALREIEARFDFHKSIDDVRGSLLEYLEATQSRSEARPEWIHFLLDQANSAQALGQYEPAELVRNRASELIWARDDVDVFPVDEGVDALFIARYIVLDLQAGSGNQERISNTFASLSGYIGRSESLDAGLLISDLISASLAYGQPREFLFGLLDQAESVFEQIDDHAVALRVYGRFAATVREISLRLAQGEERMELLERAVSYLSTSIVQMRRLAAFGDNRTLSTYCRCLLSLSHVLSRIEPTSDRALVSQRDALQQLAWVCENHPTSAAWLVYLQALDYDMPEALEWDESTEQLVPFEQVSVEEALTEYRRWRRKRAGRLTARDWKVEAWALDRRWRLEGSLAAVCSRDDPTGWSMLKNYLKHEKVELLYKTRKSTLRRQANAIGRSPELTILEIRNEGQYRRLRSLYLREDVDNRFVLDIFNDAEKELGRVPLLELARASYYHYIWQFEAAAEAYKAVKRATRDRVIFKEARIGEAGALLNLVAYDPDFGRNRAVELLEEVLRLIGNLVAFDTRAQMLHLRAHLELTKSFDSEVVEDLIKHLQRHRNYSSIVREESEFLNWISSRLVAAGGRDVAWAALADRFTEPRILLEFGALLIRAHEVGGGNSTRYLEASLTCLDGARIMSRDSVRGARQSFNIAKALLLACEAKGNDNPLDWASDSTDLVLARRLFQFAHDNSVGKYRYVVRALLNRARELDEQFRRMK